MKRSKRVIVLLCTVALCFRTIAIHAIAVSPVIQMPEGTPTQPYSEAQQYQSETQDSDTPSDADQAVNPPEDTEQEEEPEQTEESVSLTYDEDTEEAVEALEETDAEEEEEEEEITEEEEKEEETETIKDEAEIILYPAQSYEASCNNVRVEVYADEGVFPEHTTMELKAASKSAAMQAAQKAIDADPSRDEEVVDAIAVDITFVDEDDHEIQPAVENGVHVTLTALRALEGETQDVAHIESSQATILDDADVSDANNVVASFDAPHFRSMRSSAPTQQPRTEIPCVASINTIRLRMTAIIRSTRHRSTRTVTSC